VTTGSALDLRKFYLVDAVDLRVTIKRFAALLDRLTYHAYIVELTEESFRFRQRMQEKES
jgi:hypothetical protein